MLTARKRKRRENNFFTAEILRLDKSIELKLK